MAIMTEDEVFGSSEYYSGSIDNIRRVVDMISVGEGKAKSFTESVCKIYQKEVDTIIDSRLRPFYAVPLVKLTETDQWPEPIPYIASRLVAANIILVEFTEIDANESEAAEAMRNAALDELDRLTEGLFNGEQVLPGQRKRAGMAFVSPGITPRFMGRQNKR